MTSSECALVASTPTDQPTQLVPSPPNNKAAPDRCDNTDRGPERKTYTEVQRLG